MNYGFKFVIYPYYFNIDAISCYRHTSFHKSEDYEPVLVAYVLLKYDTNSMKRW